MPNPDPPQPIRAAAIRDAQTAATRYKRAHTPRAQLAAADQMVDAIDHLWTPPETPPDRPALKEAP